jgi:tRNA C32,U32 (ribose-2'-O)-methylase TrmJ
MLSILPDGVDNPANIARIGDAAKLLGATLTTSVAGRLIAVENTPPATSVYGRRALTSDVTLAFGNERRGLSSRLLAHADEVVAIPTVSRTVNTLNVAAAAAVAGWYVLRGSAPQRMTTTPQTRRPSLLILGDDHVEVGSTLRSAAAFGFRDVFLEDRAAGWFAGPSWVRREAYAAARRHKNAIRVHQAKLDDTAQFEDVVVVLPFASGCSIEQARLTHGMRQLVILGATPADVDMLSHERLRVVTLGLAESERAQLRLTSSIAMAEIARQIGRSRKAAAPRPPSPRYRATLEAGLQGEVLVVDERELLCY